MAQRPLSAVPLSKRRLVRPCIAARALVIASCSNGSLSRVTRHDSSRQPNLASNLASCALRPRFARQTAGFCGKRRYAFAYRLASSSSAICWVPRAIGAKLERIAGAP